MLIEVQALVTQSVYGTRSERLVGLIYVVYNYY